jgi:ribosomal protein S18 acetylase RimI-like enzyme
MQFSLQTRYYEQLYPEMDYRIILDNGAPAGRFIVDRTKDEIRLIDIAVMPAHRGAGIGQALLRGLLREADALGKPVVLHVEHLNRARHLYERLGFRPAGEAGIYLRMEWHPAGVSGHIRG